MALIAEAFGDPDPIAAEVVAEIVGRCAPSGVMLHVGASLAGVDGGRPRGQYVPVDPSIRIATDMGVCEAMDTAHHEVWHAVDPWLSAEARGAVGAMAAGGRAMPTAYLSDAEERRARLYAAVARAWDEGLRLYIGHNDRALAVMWSVYSGAVADEIAAANARQSRTPRSMLRRVLDVIWN